MDDNGGAYTYYKLRDLGTALGFTVDWSAEKGIFIETGSTQAPTPIPEPTPEPTPEPAPTVTVPENKISRMLKNPSYYEYSNEVTVTLSFTGECIGRYTNTDTNCEIIWTLKDAEGYKIDSGSAYSPILEEGDKFRNVEALIFDLEPNQTYNLDIGTSIK